MSRIGKQPVVILPDTSVTISSSNEVVVKGKLGELSLQVTEPIAVRVDESVVTVERPNDQKEVRAKHGLYRALIFNMIEGVFCKYDGSEYCINGEIISHFKSFLGTEFDDSVNEVNTSVKRKKLIEFLIKYMQIHLPDFKRPTSLNILYELFG